jgi:hypothetical protein
VHGTVGRLAQLEVAGRRIGTRVARDIPGLKSSRPMSWSTFVKNREYSRCRIAWVTPPTYWSTGSHSRTTAGSNGAVSFVGSA